MISTTLTLVREDGILHVGWDGSSDEPISRLRVTLHLATGIDALFDQAQPINGDDSWSLHASPRIDGHSVFVAYEITTATGDSHYGQLALPRSSSEAARCFEHDT